jgi:signal transduction histidine kinase
VSRPWRVALALPAAAPIMAIVIGLQRYVLSELRGSEVDWVDYLMSHVSFWVAWTIVGVVAAPLVSRIIGGEWSRLAKTLALTIVGAVTIVAQPLLDIAQRALVLPPRISTPDMNTVLFFVFGPLAHNVLVYVAIVGLTYAMWYYEHFRDREILAAQLGAQLTQARLDALRAQLNPHFLFNAMNSIAMLVRGSHNAEAVRMLAGLSDLLRWALDDGLPQQIPLNRELEFIDRYLSIEQVRFQNRLRVEKDIDERALSMLVPTLLLQPLVENAVRHGIGQRRSAGELRIVARVDRDELMIEIRDDGPGLPPTYRTRAGAGVGLRNTEARLAAVHGTAWSLDMTTPPAGGTLVTVRIPATAASIQEVEPVLSRAPAVTVAG